MDLHAAVAVSMLPASRARACAIFKALRQARPAAGPVEVLEGLGVPSGERMPIAERAGEAASRALDAASALGIAPIPWFDPRYSALLECTADPPPVLWALGDVSCLSLRAVAIVGSRAATPYALDVARRLAAELARRGIVVASGLARGADSAAHRGALDAAGRTIAVLGSGLDQVYPAEHQELADIITETGLVISELGPGAHPLPEHFPLRNRIISGISLAVVVVEASEKSGSLITARCAMEQGRDVMAVPGSILTGRNRGSHSLLKDGARMVETADDILDELGWPGARLEPAPVREGPRDPVLARLEPGEGSSLDELVEATGILPSRLLTRLMELELDGRVRRDGGRFFRLR